ncbi:MAG: GtrA family protein [Clostridia bacterium]|nr:GtrA family protein [Clostridia bacterium]
MSGAVKKGKIMKQILKFGVVGGLAFLIDFIVYSLVLYFVNWENDYLIAGFMGFSISLIFNYFASMAFVFQRKDNADKRKEFLIFMILSLIGLGINTLVLWVCMDIIYANVSWYSDMIEMLYQVFQKLVALAGVQEPRDLASLVAKVVATAIVMVYNFISRKMTLEKKDDENETKSV